MTRSRWILLLPLLALPSLGPAACPSGGPGRRPSLQQYLLAPGYVEPHTPGSGAPASRWRRRANGAGDRRCRSRI